MICVGGVSCCRQASWHGIREDFLDEKALEGTAHLDKWRGEAKYCWWREEQGHELNAENWVACELRNRLIQSRGRAMRVP